jgi:multidrug efflux system membrane fusion protein
MNLQFNSKRSEARNLGELRPARTYVIGGLALFAVLAGFYFFTHDTAPKIQHRAAVAPVRVAAAQKRDMGVVEHTIGTVVANASVSVTARVQGQLVRAAFTEGQMVKAGDLLFQIDPAPYQAAYDSAMATLAGARSAATRSEALMKQNAIAAQANDNAQSAYLQAKANAETARLNLAYTQIRSPIDGKTGPILVQPGNLVSVNGTNQPLVTITQVQPIKVSFALPQGALPRIQKRVHGKGLTAVINLHAQGGEDLKAPVDFVSNAVNPTNGTIELRASFPNKDMALVPGQLVDVTVQLDDIPGAVVVPREAVNEGQTGQFVYVVTAEKQAEVRPVSLLFDDGTDAAIQGKVQPGELVIIDGQLRVVPGAKVSFGKVQRAARKPAAERMPENGTLAGRRRPSAS